MRKKSVTYIPIIEVDNPTSGIKEKQDGTPVQYIAEVYSVSSASVYKSLGIDVKDALEIVIRFCTDNFDSNSKFTVNSKRYKISKIFGTDTSRRFILDID